MTIRYRLCGASALAGGLFAALAMGAPAFAQDAPPAQTLPAPAQATQAEEPATVEDVVVTGSRIPRPNLEQPTPVSTVTAEAIETSGTQDLGAIISELPAFSSNGSTRANGNSFDNDGGLNFLDLRSLGSARTLTLVDGKRHVGGSAGSAAVDLSSIPAGLVERVETITGGASAIYGSDAVSGVVNIILKDDFEGSEFSVETGGSEDGDGKTWAASALLGRGFGGGRGNATLSLFYDHTDAVRANDIPAFDDWGTILNPLDTGPNDGIPDTLTVRNVLSDYVDENGTLIDAATFGIITALTNDGRPTPQRPRTGTNSFAFGSFDGPCDTCFSLDDYILLIPDTDRYGANVRLRYDLTDQVSAYGDLKYIRADIADYFQPSFTFGEYLIQPDNAFITPEIAAVVAGRPITLGRFNADVGVRANDITRETLRGVVGLEGQWSTGLADIDWDLSYNYGQTESSIFQRNRQIPGNFAAAIDAVRTPGGQIVCRDQTPDLTTQTDEACVPFNPFGQTNSAAAIDYVSHSALTTEKITQDVVLGVFSFDTSKFFNLQGGPVQFAGGFEYREETSANINDEFVKSGRSESAPQPDASGGFEVAEAFLEFNAPLLSDVTGAYRLSVDGAYRYADYSTVGGAEAWKVGLLYAPIRDITLRGTYSRAVRAPNITEAFLPSTAGFSQVIDPCDVNEIDNDPDRAANCAAAGVPVGFVSITNAAIDSVVSGNPDLDAEEATSFTYGVVLQPRFLPGLSFTADYYDIQIDKAISLIDPQDIIDNCYDASGGLDPVFCALQTRGGDDNLDSVRSTYVNAAALTNKGWDFELAYRSDLEQFADRPGLGWLRGRLTGSLTATHLTELDFFAFADRPEEIDNEKGELGDPEWSFKSRLTWEDGPLALTWEARHEGEAAIYDVTPQPGINPSESVFPNSVEALTYHDFVVRYRFEGLLGSRDVEVFAGVNNAFDEQLPDGLTGSGTSSAYDLFGRQFFGGVRARF